MSFLDPSTVIRITGYEYDGASVPQAEAVAFAENVIREFSSAVWYAPLGAAPDFDAPQIFSLEVHLTAKAFFMQLPKDVQTVTTVSPLETGGSFRLNKTHLVYSTGRGRVAFPEGFYMVEGTRGFTPDEQDHRAAALLAAYYLSLADEKRSAYNSYAEGDFSGVYRLTQLPVPEAIQLLHRRKSSRAQIA